MPATERDGSVSVDGRTDDASTTPVGGAALRAAARRAEDALSVARQRVAAHGRRTTVSARAASVQAEEQAHLRAAAEAAEVEALLRAAVHAATATRAGGAAVSVGSVRVRRHAEATAAVRVPLLVSPASGGVRVVAGEGAMPAVVALAATLVAGVLAAGGPTRETVVVNPRRRALPAALRALPRLREVHDGRGLLGAVSRDDARGWLVAFDHPHDLGLAGRRLLHAASEDHPFRALLIHHAADHAEVDLEHRRLRTSRTGVPHPRAGCELWPARGGWRWPAHPQLCVDLPTGSAEIAVSEPGPTDGASRAAPEPAAARGAASHDSRGDGPDLGEYERLLDRLARVAHDLDDAVAAARAEERRALDHAAAVRRGTLAAIDVEERAIDLHLRRVVGGRSPPSPRLRTVGPLRTAAPRGDPVSAMDLAPLRAARAALARAVDPARRPRDG